MHDPARAKYPYASLTEAFARVILYTKQREDENLLDYVTRFKSTKNVLKSHVGSHVLDRFIENTEEYCKTSDINDKTTLKDEAFDCWMAYLLIKNADQAKYGSLTTGLSSQFSLENNQYPKKITMATDILANHKHDNFKSKNNKNNKNKNLKEKSNENDNEEAPKNEKSFAQDDKIVCYICGEPGHKVPKCKKKNKNPKELWFMNRAQQHYMCDQSQQEDDNSLIKSEAPSQCSSWSGRSSDQKGGWSGLHITLQQNEADAHKSHGMSEHLKSTKDYIMLDNSLTISLFANPDLVDNICHSKNTMLLATNAGTQENNTKATVEGFGDVWFNKRPLQIFLASRTSRRSIKVLGSYKMQIKKDKTNKSEDKL